MKFGIALASVLLGGAVLGAPGGVSAYCRTTTEDPIQSDCAACATDGRPLYWAVSHPRYIFNKDGFANLDDAVLRAAIQRSFGKWNAIECETDDGRTLPIGLDIEVRPGTTSLEVGPKADEPNDNVIVYFSGERWLSDPTLNPSAYALTAIWFNKLNGEILGADMHFNGGMGALGVCDDNGCPDGYVDIENVATHEAGHFIGLAHSTVEGSTMWCSADRPEVEKRTLSDDDIKGACAVYPPGRSFVKDAPSEPQCTLHDGKVGSVPSLALLALGLALAGLRKKR
jgi:hypothetical protein